MTRRIDISDPVPEQRFSCQAMGNDLTRCCRAVAFVKQVRRVFFSLFLAVAFLAMPAQAYYFQGYFVPVVLVSPMQDDHVYTPAGMGVITSRAGFRVHPVTGKGDFHTGVDLAARLNDAVYNLMDGYVTRVGYRGNLGVAVEVYHPYPNVTTISGPLNAYTVKVGDWVQRGRVIGYAGCTGRSTGVHLHYTVKMHETGDYVDAGGYLDL